MSVSDEDEVIFGEEQQEEEEEEEDYPEDTAPKQHEVEPCSLTQDVIGQNLSLLCRTGDGLSHAFVRLDLQNRNLADIVVLSSFVHLRFLDISSNYLTDLSPLATLTELLWLKADFNRVQSVRGQPLSQLPYLQWFSLMSNCLSGTEGLGGPALESLNLIGNTIQTVSGLDYDKLTNLVSLELRGNHLETTDGIYLPNLRRLYLAQNKIKRLEGLDKLEHLTILHLRDNQLETLNGISSSMKSLQYLNIRNYETSQNKKNIKQDYREGRCCSPAAEERCAVDDSV
ncbi:hypothetical protein QTP70_016333 [Hemibagrus guttatus]|uniref:Leucine-rich repeat-containing protein 23 n=1 Tax=Hemibagrus guttatus TaxID=175788 RepID=A0AAE0QEL1_9TELE|nr:hypothetical protein QTP70_016333 [Hemibagrus guttatus]KAK3547150.1 hypothetical protein QTP86_015615 [Hemibagrus guttatus]